MFKRLSIYLKEMYPPLSRLFLGYLLFFEIYFLVILTGGSKEIHIGLQEIIGGYTIFSFLLGLRIADEFKDRQVDLRLFPQRPYPSGRVHTSDLAALLTFVFVSMTALNLIFMNNRIYFIILIVYGILMSFWFFGKHVIQKSLPLALITHNPVQILVNLYVISFACIKYGLPLLSLSNLLIAFTLYFPGLIWEISRKTLAPKEETEYTTYSKLFGHKKSTQFIMFVMFFDMITSSLLVYQLFPLAVITVIATYAWLCLKCTQFIDNPERFKLVDKVIVYEYVAESTVILLEAAFIFRWFIK